MKLRGSPFLGRRFWHDSCFQSWERPHPISGMQDASPGQGAPRSPGHCDTGTCPSRQNLGAFPYRPAGPLVERARLVWRCLLRLATTTAVLVATAGMSLGLKEGSCLKRSRSGWAGQFWELRLPSCKCPGEEGTAGPRWAGTQLGTGKCCLHKPGHRVLPAWQPEGRVWGCQTPLFLKRTQQKQGGACPGWLQALPCGMLALHGAGRIGMLGHTPV